MTRRLAAELALAAGARLGEGPAWHPTDGVLHWIDLARGELHRFDPRTGGDAVLYAGDPIGSFAPRRRGGYVVASGRALGLLQPGADSLEPVASVPDDVAGVFNDGKCDAQGRFWVGTSTGDNGAPDAALLRLDPDMSLHVMLRGVIISNGLDWDPERGRMYYVDSFACGLDALTLSPTGEVESRTRVADVANDTGAPFGFTVPDGLCLDTEGCAWVAIHGLGEVHRFTPDGALDTVITLPTLGPTSCAFGGDDLRDLYVTSGAVLPRDHPRAHALDGALFVCRPGVQGRPMHQFAG
jgi:sugar lactone lactonase YvrE